jgi:hypothetical protein
MGDAGHVVRVGSRSSQSRVAWGGRDPNRPKHQGMGSDDKGSLAPSNKTAIVAYIHILVKE